MFSAPRTSAYGWATMNTAAANPDRYRWSWKSLKYGSMTVAGWAFKYSAADAASSNGADGSVSHS
jgi:hypothetical protein